MFSESLLALCGLLLSYTRADALSPSLDVRQVSATTPGLCGYDPFPCTVFGTVSGFHWERHKAPVTFTAFTIVTVINTVSNTTSTSTVLADTPEGYNPPPTNSEGRHVQTLTYDLNGQATTTTVVYPTFFLEWAPEYAVNGSYALSYADGRTKCINLGSSSTVIPISGNPQPQPPNNTDRDFATDSEDALGWGYKLVFDGGSGSGLVQSHIDLLPENPDVPHSVIKNCVASVNFPADDKFDASWLAVGANSVSYVGNDDYTESSGNSPGPTTKADPVSNTAADGTSGAPGTYEATATNIPATGMTPTGPSAPTQTSQNTLSSAFAAPVHIPRPTLLVCGVAALSMFFS